MLRRLALIALPLASCASTPPGDPLPQIAPLINATLSERVDEIAAGDVLAVDFVAAEDTWDQTDISVLDSGEASFLGLDAISVTGKTLEELDSELTQRYRELVTPSDLTVRVMTRAERAVFVMGEVQSPGRYEFTEGVTLLEALALAGGHVRDTARLEQVLLVRLGPTGEDTMYWKIDASQEFWTSAVPLRLQHRDVVYVPPSAATAVNDWVDRYIRRNIPLPSLFGPAY